MQECLSNSALLGDFFIETISACADNWCLNWRINSACNTIILLYDAPMVIQEKGTVMSASNRDKLSSLIQRRGGRSTPTSTLRRLNSKANTTASTNTLRRTTGTCLPRNPHLRALESTRKTSTTAIQGYNPLRVALRKGQRLRLLPSRPSLC